MKLLNSLKIVILFIFLSLFLIVNSKGYDGYRVQDVYIKNNEKIVFLTFDDGPSNNTNKILDILKEKNIKATFFVLGCEIEIHEDILRRIHDEGHSIGNHTYSHLNNIKNCNPEEFIKDLKKNEDIIKRVLNVDDSINLIRFPFGKNSAKYKNKKLYLDKLNECGLVSIDWNVDSRDSISKNPSKEFIMNNIIKQSQNKTRVVLLMHDSATRKNTVNALPEIIEYFQNNGFSFEKISSKQ